MVSAESSGIVLAGSTILISDLPISVSQMKAIFTLGSQEYTTVAGSIITFVSATLSIVGPPVTVSGKRISLESSRAVADGQTITFSRNTVLSSSPGLGALIMLALRNVDGQSNGGKTNRGVRATSGAGGWTGGAEESLASVMANHTLAVFKGCEIFLQSLRLLYKLI